MTLRNLMPVLAASLMLLAGCGENSPAPESRIDASHKQHIKGESSYQKPGAAVRFSHNYKGPIALGEDYSMQLSFAVAESAGRLDLKLRPDAGLSTDLSTNQFAFGPESNQTKTIDLKVRADQAGKYYLTIFASLTDGQGDTQHRVFAVAIEAGDALDQPGKKSATMGESASGEPIVILPAQETVSK